MSNVVSSFAARASLVWESAWQLLETAHNLCKLTLKEAFAGRSRQCPILGQNTAVNYWTTLYIGFIYYFKHDIRVILNLFPISRIVNRL